MRVVVAAGRVAGADLRVARAGEWRTNVGAGATELPVRRLQSEASELAVAAVDALGGDLFGVDLLPAPGGLVVLEVNGAVEFDGIYSFPGRDVYDDVAATLGLPELGLRASEPAAIGGETP